jgi:NADPH:quinone reductase-like Zn-dependent oxidoreductase
MTTDRMRAVVQDRYGDASTLHVADRDVPEPGPGEVLVRVIAAAVDQGTRHLMHGTPLLIRPAYGLRRPRHPVPGRDVAGVIERVGPTVTGYDAGDAVIGTADGSLAEFAVVPVHRLTRAPSTLSLVDAAALPISGLTALQAVTRAGITTGQRVLVTGAGGGVGSFAVQIAVASGAQVTGVCSASKHELVLSLGATDVIDYSTDDFADGSRTWDVVIDTAGNRPLRELRRATKPSGTVMIVGGEQRGGRWLSGFDRNLRAPLLSAFVRQRLAMLASAETSDDLAILRGLVEDGLVRPVIGGTFALDQAADALRVLESGHATGKLVITVAEWPPA